MSFIDLNEIEEREMAPGFKVRFVHTGNMTVSYWNVAKGALLPEHFHHHEQVSSIIHGEFELTVDGEAKALGPGGAAVIPPNAVHSGRALTDCMIIDVFHPVREDYL